MTAITDGRVDVDRLIGVHLNEAVIVAAVPVVGAPRLIAHQFQLKALICREREMRRGAPTAFGDRRFHDFVQPIRRHEVAITEFLHPCREVATPWHKLINTRECCIITLERPQRWPQREEALSFVRERQPFAIDHVKTEARTCHIRRQRTCAPLHCRIARRALCFSDLCA